METTIEGLGFHDFGCRDQGCGDLGLGCRHHGSRG